MSKIFHCKAFLTPKVQDVRHKTVPIASKNHFTTRPAWCQTAWRQVQAQLKAQSMYAWGHIPSRSERKMFWSCKVIFERYFKMFDEYEMTNFGCPMYNKKFSVKSSPDKQQHFTEPRRNTNRDARTHFTLHVHKYNTPYNFTFRNSICLYIFSCRCLSKIWLTLPCP